MEKNKYTIAAEKRWAKVPKDKRSSITEAASKARWKGVTKEDRRKVALKLVRARNKKKNANTTQKRKKEKVS